MELINSNPNRCIFRYFKRGALLARDGEKSDWIFVIKSVNSPYTYHDKRLCFNKELILPG